MSSDYAFPKQFYINNTLSWCLAAPFFDSVVTPITDEQIWQIRQAVAAEFHRSPPPVSLTFQGRQIVPCPPPLEQAAELSRMVNTAQRIPLPKRTWEEISTSLELDPPPLPPLPSIWDGYFGAVLEVSRSARMAALPDPSLPGKENNPTTDTPAIKPKEKKSGKIPSASPLLKQEHAIHAIL